MPQKEWALVHGGPKRLRAESAAPAELQMMQCPKCGHRQAGTQSCAACGIVFENFFRSHQKIRELNAKLGKPAPAALLMKCPKCGNEQVETTSCQRCGIFFEKFFRSQERMLPTAPPAASAVPTVDEVNPVPEVSPITLRQRLSALPKTTRMVAVALIVLVLLAGATMRMLGTRVSAVSLSDVVESTAYIVVEGGGNTYSGTGFLVRRDGDVGVLATNAHVVEVPGQGDPTINAVFGSGQPDARKVRATIIGLDRSHDLALLQVDMAGVTASPLALDLSLDVERTRSVLVVGFPFGERLSTAHETPAATVSKGIVSSIRNDVNEIPFAIQVDADINPGNSGGPVINEDGSLLGMAQAKVSTTQIGFAIPAHILLALMEGQLTDLTLTSGTPSSLRANLTDPLGEIQGASLILAPQDQARFEISRDTGLWDKISDVELEIKFEPNAYTSTHWEAGLPEPAGLKRSDYVGQVMQTRKNGRRVYQAPFRIKIPKGGLQIAVSGPGVRSNGAAQVAGGQPPAQTKAPPPELTVDERLQRAGAKIYKASGPFEDIQIAGGGRYLVAQMLSPPKVGVFDVAAGSWQYVSIPTPEFLLAANREFLFVLTPQLETLTRWSLGNLNSQADTEISGLREVRVMAVGVDSTTSPLLIADAADLHFLDPVTLRRLPIKRPAELEMAHVLNSRIPNDVRMRAAANGSAFTWWRTKTTPAGIHLLQLSGSTLKYLYEHTTGGYLAPSPDGSIIYTGEEGRFGATLKSRDPQTRKRRQLIPDISGHKYLEVLRGREQGQPVMHLRRFRVADDSEEGAPLEVFEMHSTYAQNLDLNRGALTEDKRYILLADRGKLLTIPRSDDRIVVRSIP